MDTMSTQGPERKAKPRPEALGRGINSLIEDKDSSPNRPTIVIERVEAAASVVSPEKFVGAIVLGTVFVAACTTVGIRVILSLFPGKR